MKNNCIEFGRRLREARENAKMSGYKLAMLLDVESPNITHWESGRSYPRVDNLIKIAAILGVSIDWLLTGK